MPDTIKEYTQRLPLLPQTVTPSHNANIKHASEAIDLAKKDGDFNAVIVRIPDNGIAGELNVIDHNLGRIPVGCQIILKNAACDVYVVTSNENNIVVKFTVSRVDLNLRIW